MKRAILSAAIFCLLPSAPSGAQTVAPDEVTSSAIAAVKDLGEQVVLGRHQVAIDRMYPQWKDSVAKRAGGMDKLEAKLAGIGKMMTEQGVSLRSFKPTGVPTAYEVVNNQWLLLIPTVTEYRITKPAEKGGVPQFLVITSTGFQVAISEKGKNDWTFIDGAGVTVPELRRLFITLPETMELPPVERKSSEAKR